MLGPALGPPGARCLRTVRQLVVSGRCVGAGTGEVGIGHLYGGMDTRTPRSDPPAKVHLRQPVSRDVDEKPRYEPSIRTYPQ